MEVGFNHSNSTAKEKEAIVQFVRLEVYSGTFTMVGLAVYELVFRH